MSLIFRKECFLSLAIAGYLIAGTVSAKEQPTTQVETLLRSDASWDGVPYASYPDGSPELSILKITVPANQALPWHTHPMPNAAYILDGEITVEKENGEKKLVSKGQVLAEMVGQRHRGYTGNTPVVLLVFYAGTKGMPLSQQ